MAPAQLQLEVTESLAAQDAQVQQRLHELKAIGITLALDDFGTGYSSLSYLQHLSFDVVKVDRAFVQELHRDGGGARIVEAIIRLVHGLGAEVVAEGVEEPAQLDLLAKLGCDTVQGYLLGRPMPAHRFEAQFCGRSLFMLE